MASTNKTKHIGLPQWEASDKPERSDFNTAFAAVDSALANKVSQAGNATLSLTDSITAHKIVSRNNGDSAYAAFLCNGTDDPFTRIYSFNGIEGTTTLIHPVTGTIWPSRNGSGDLGAPDFKYKDIYASNGTIKTSDKREKEKVNVLDTSISSKFIMALQPVSYKYKNGTSGRTHHGLIAQEVEQAMKDCGMNSLDFAGLIKSPVYEKEDGSGQVVDYTYGLRYSEFIPMMIAVIQQQQHRIGQLEAARKE